MRWEAHVWSFTANSPQTTLVFRSLTPGACGPVVDMVHVFLLPPGAPVARVSVKRVVGPAGTPDPHWTDANVENMVAEASAMHGAATGTTFLLEEIVDLVDPRLPGPWFDMNLASGNLASFESAAENDPCAYEWRTDAINVYLVSTLLSPFGPAGGVCSFPTATPAPDDVVVLASIPAAFAGAWEYGRSLAHELGHYFGLYHTFETGLGVEAQGVCQALAPNCANAGDLVCDTPADPVPAVFGIGNLAALEALYGCGTCFGCDSCPYRTLRWNVMSYYGGITLQQALFTPGQVSRVQTFTAQYRTDVLVGGSAASIAAVSPSAGTYPGPTTLTVTGANLPTTGFVQLFIPGQPPSQVAVGPTATSVTANFTNPIPPGLHCVGIRRSSDTVAYLAGGLHVRPSA
ncbi:MAG TPA: M43 family zinc metalloprotease, partial [Planctomycetota bacterium]|nr:M43 family zinc metalloprotease [Planctomycetota bacterium]